MHRCTKKLEFFGDIAAEAERNDEAVTQYSTALSLDPIFSQDLYVKRSRIYMAKGLWGDAIDDVTKVRHVCPHQVQFSHQGSLGDSAGPIIFLAIREGTDGVGKCKSDR